MKNDKLSIVLMVQGIRKLFCYYTISPIIVKKFEDLYGENSWNDSKPILKVYWIDNGLVKEMKTIYLDPFANSWYIDIDRDDIDVFVKLGRILPNNKLETIATSNIVTTPRGHQSEDRKVYYIDTSELKKGLNYYPNIIVENRKRNNDFLDKIIEETIDKYNNLPSSKNM